MIAADFALQAIGMARMDKSPIRSGCMSWSVTRERIECRRTSNHRVPLQNGSWHFVPAWERPFSIYLRRMLF